MPTYEEELERLTKEIEEVKKNIRMRPPTEEQIENSKRVEAVYKEVKEEEERAYTETQKKHLKFKALADEQFALMVLANKIIDEKLVSSDEPRYVKMREEKKAGDKDAEFISRKFAYFHEMEHIGGNWKVNWVDEITTYYKHLPYHDEINIMLDGKHVLIPKKTYELPKHIDNDVIQHIQSQLDVKMGGSEKS